MYVNDMHTTLSACKYIQLADDTTIYLKGKDGIAMCKLCNAMNNELDQLQDWFRANKLRFNAKKYNYMYLLFTNRKVIKPITLLMNNVTIPKVYNTKFLGITTDDKLEWDMHVLTLQAKLAKIMYILSKIKHILPTRDLRCLYFTLVHPHLEYGCILWGYDKKRTT